MDANKLKELQERCEAIMEKSTHHDSDGRCQLNDGISPYDFKDIIIQETKRSMGTQPPKAEPVDVEKLDSIIENMDWIRKECIDRIDLETNELSGLYPQLVKVGAELKILRLLSQSPSRDEWKDVNQWEGKKIPPQTKSEEV